MRRNDKEKGKKDKKPRRPLGSFAEETVAEDSFGEISFKQPISVGTHKKRNTGFNPGAFGQSSSKRNEMLERKKQEQRAKKELTKKAAAEAKQARLAEEKRQRQRQEEQKAAIKKDAKTTLAGRLFLKENSQEKKSTDDSPTANYLHKARREETAKNKFFGKTNSKVFKSSTLATHSQKPKKTSKG